MEAARAQQNKSRPFPSRLADDFTYHWMTRLVLVRLVYYIALKNAGVPVEMHLYAEGKHAFGLRPSKFPITYWPKLVETWLGTIGMIPE